MQPASPIPQPAAPPTAPKCTEPSYIEPVNAHPSHQTQVLLPVLPSSRLAGAIYCIGKAGSGFVVASGVFAYVDDVAKISRGAMFLCMRRGCKL
jgi:hypothetical protein